jgi:hypothetical protein
MKVHRVRLYHSTAGSQSYHNWLDQWLLNVDAALQSEVDNEPPTLRKQIDGGGEWYQGDLAFDWDGGKANILDNIEQYADSYCDWFQIEYHECSHDETDATACSVQEIRKNGTIPNYVPTISVQ